MPMHMIVARLATIVCPRCDGECTVEVLHCTSNRPANECCGGCTRDEECPTCHGRGTVEVDAEELEAALVGG